MSGIRPMPCNHCNKYRCHFCYKYRTDPRYRTLWGGDPADARPDMVNSLMTSSITSVPTVRRVRDPNKPKVNIAELAEKRRH